MEALQTVFDYIKAILDIIKKFFDDVMPKEDAEDTEGEEA